MYAVGTLLPPPLAAGSGVMLSVWEARRRTLENTSSPSWPTGMAGKRSERWELGEAHSSSSEATGEVGEMMGDAGVPRMTRNRQRTSPQGQKKNPWGRLSLFGVSILVLILPFIS